MAPSGARGPAEDVDQVEGAEDQDEGEHGDDGEGGREHREGDVAEDLPAARAVDQRRVAQILRHVLQAGQVEDDGHAVPLPELDDVDGLHRPDWIGLPLPLPAAKPDVGQEGIDDADDRVEHQDPDDPGRDGRHDHGQEDDDPVDVGHPRAAVEHHRQPERDGVLEDEDDGEELGGVAGRLPELCATEDVAKVVEPDEVADRPVPAPVEDAQVERPDRGIEEDQATSGSRQDEPEAGPALEKLAVAAAGTRARRQSGRRDRMRRPGRADDSPSPVDFGWLLRLRVSRHRILRSRPSAWPAGPS